METMNQPEVEWCDDGSVWVYYYDQKIDITDKFEDGICYIKVNGPEESLYMTIKYKDGYAASPNRFPDPDSFR